VGISCHDISVSINSYFFPYNVKWSKWHLCTIIYKFAKYCLNRSALVGDLIHIYWILLVCIPLNFKKIPNKYAQVPSYTVIVLKSCYWIYSFKKPSAIHSLMKIYTEYIMNIDWKDEKIFMTTLLSLQMLNTEFQNAWYFFLYFRYYFLFVIR